MSNFENGKTLRNRLNGRTQTAQKRQRKKKARRRASGGTDCRQKAILPPKGRRIVISANERISEFLDFAIQARFAYVNKLAR